MNIQQNRSVLKYRLSIIILGLFAILLSSCAQQVRNTAKKQSNTVLFNSFESTQDTLRWYWADMPEFTADTPPGGGSQALKVIGGMLLPSGTFISQPLKHGGYFTIQCWGKTLDFGGMIELTTVSKHDIGDNIQAHIVDPDWRFVTSEDTLYCPPNQSLMLTLQPGMIKHGGIVVDMLEVKKVGKADDSRLSRRTALK